MNGEIRKRLKWVKLYEKTKNASLVCRRCGISHPTLRKWWQRYQALGETDLQSQSRQPKTSPNRKVLNQEEQWILTLRHERNLGARLIQHELERLYNYYLSLSTIQKVLQRHQVKPLKRVQRTKGPKRYQKDIPGERVQLDTCKIRAGLFQYTAIDDCTQLLVVGLYSRRTAANTCHFLERVLEQMPFPIQRVQSDRGREFTAYEVQDLLWEWGIKYRPTRPGSPHLNGKVERAQQTVLNEFYPTVDLDDEALELQLEKWQFYYNWQRVHGAIGEAPMEKVNRLLTVTPFWEEVSAASEPQAERMKMRSFGPGSH